MNIFANKSRKPKYSELPLFDNETEDTPLKDFKKERTILQVDGMTCSSCTGSVENAIRDLGGVDSVQVSLMTNQAIVEHNGEVTPELLKNTVDDIGFDASVVKSEVLAFVDKNSIFNTSMNKNIKTSVSVLGMTCSACVESVSGAIRELPGIKLVEVSLLTEEAVVEHTSEISAKAIIDQIDDIGFEARLLNTSEADACSSGTALDAASAANRISISKIGIQGITCSACVKSVTDAVKAIEGVRGIFVSLLTEEAIVEHNSNLQAEKIKHAIDDIGFEANVFSTEKLESAGDKNEIMEHTNFKYYGTLPDNSKLIILHQFPKIDMISINDGILSLKYNVYEVGIRDVVMFIKSKFDIDLLMMNSVVDNNAAQLKLLAKYKEIEYWKKCVVKSLIFGLPLFIFNHFKILNIKIIPGLYLDNIIEMLSGTYLQISVGRGFYISAYKAFKHGSMTMDLLIVTSTTMSYVFSVISLCLSIISSLDKEPMLLFDTAGMLFLFVCLGKWLESKSKGKTTSSLSELMNLIPTNCRIVRNFDASINNMNDETFDENENIENVQVDLIQINDVLLIKPGEKIPTDGIVVQGESEVNEALLTGESLPVIKKFGSRLIGGSINLTNVMYMRVNKIGEQTQLSKIISLVKNAQFKKAPIQKYSDYVASKFVPSIILLACTTFLFWYIVIKTETISTDSTWCPMVFKKYSQNGVFFNSLKIGISVMVIACPCALGLAAPTAIMVGSGVGAQNGILIKGGDVFEALSNVNVVCFDKTNTLTTGEMTLVGVNVNERNIEQYLPGADLLFELIKMVESNNDHPISNAIIRGIEYLNLAGASNYVMTSANNIISQGLVAEFKLKDDVSQEKLVLKVGNSKLAGGLNLNEELKISEGLTAYKGFTNNETLAQDVDDSICTSVYVSINDNLVCVLKLEDQLKPDAKTVVEKLHLLKIDTLMITGDNLQVSYKLGGLLNIPKTNIFAEVSPDEKQGIVSRLKEASDDKQQKKVLFIGDGINDAAAITIADVGVSFNGSTDIAASAADVILLDDRKLMHLIDAIALSKSTFNIIKTNFVLATVYNLLMIPLAIIGVMTPLLGAASMSVSSVCVVGNSLRLNKWKSTEK